MKIGILTFHRAYNCGAALQAWALRTVLVRMGHTVEFVYNEACKEKRWILPRWEKRGDWRVESFRKLWCMGSFVRHFHWHLLSVPYRDFMRWRYRSFWKRFLPERTCPPSEFHQVFDLVVVGSDQVWNEKICREESPLFFAEWARGNVRLIAYAASTGDGEIPESTARRLQKALPRFSQVSVREKRTQQRLTDLSGREIAHTLDPALLMSAQDYGFIADGPVPKEPYLFMYVLQSNDRYIQVARSLSRRLGVRCVVAVCYQYSCWKKPSEVVWAVSPDRLVQYVRHAKYVLSASFHGTVLGVVFRKPFLSFLGKPESGESRSGSLLRLIGCEDRLVCSAEKGIDEMQKILTAPLPDYSSILDKERAKSLAWLESAVSNA